MTCSDCDLIKSTYVRTRKNWREWRVVMAEKRRAGTVSSRTE